MVSEIQQEYTPERRSEDGGVAGEGIEIGPRLPSSAEVSACIDTLERTSRALKRVLKMLDDPAPARVRKATDDLASQDLGQVVELPRLITTWLEHERATRGTRLRAGLREVCVGRSIPVKVLTREPLELYLAPLSVRVDVEADRADLSFGRIRLARCRADATEIVSTRDDALQELEGDGWEPEAFLARLRQAWSRASGGRWAELIDVLPEVALLCQSAAFRKNPTEKAFRPYPRVQLAYDLWRLRRDRCLSAGGWRLTLGTATGGSTRDKSRVWWLEDGRGGGQYHLTLRFVKEGEHA